MQSLCKSYNELKRCFLLLFACEWITKKKKFFWKKAQKTVFSCFFLHLHLQNDERKKNGFYLVKRGSKLKIEKHFYVAALKFFFGWKRGNYAMMRCEYIVGKICKWKLERRFWSLSWIHFECWAIQLLRMSWMI